jgi:hypothetical protein
MNRIEMKHLWHSTIEKLPSPDEEVLGYASSPDLEDLGYHVVTFDPGTESWHEVNGTRSFNNITHWLPLEPPTIILRAIHREQEKKRKRMRRENKGRREDKKGLPRDAL